MYRGIVDPTLEARWVFSFNNQVVIIQSTTAILPLFMKKSIITPAIMSIFLILILSISLLFPDIFSSIEESFRLFVATGGIPVILVLSAIENFVLINALIPGAIVILTAMSVSSGNPMLALGIYLAIVIGSYIGQVASFFAGRKTGISSGYPSYAGFATTLWHPQLGSITSLRAGQSGASFRSYLFRLSVTAIPWSILWGGTLYFSGKQLSFSDQVLPLALIYCLGWLIVELRRK